MLSLVLHVQLIHCLTFTILWETTQITCVNCALEKFWDSVALRVIHMQDTRYITCVNSYFVLIIYTQLFRGLSNALLKLVTSLF